ncbi:unnamed protein product [Victoria cruziana]
MGAMSPTSLLFCNSLKGLPVTPSSSSQARNRCSRLPTTVEASWQEVAGVLVFSAFPFTIVKAIASSSLGATLQERIQATKAANLANYDNNRALAERARAESFWYGEERPRWLGPLLYDYPPYLTGELPGDYAFDIAGLSKEHVALQKYFNFEVLHARWAMLASVGVLVPELLDHFGVVHFVEPVWWKVGYAKLKGDTLDYLGIPGLRIAGGQGIIIIAICQALLMVGPEYARYCGIDALEPLGIYLPGDVNYPGGILFDPLGLSKDPTSFEELKVKEIKNGRLAMVAWLGFFLQAAITGKGPVENLLDHLSDPLLNNLFSFIKL